MAICRGEKPDIVQLIHRAMDGEEIDSSKLSAEHAGYVKTVRVLNGRALYSHSWLES
jgi:5-methyltetrahydrofolate corrinoid/iron sulfur protein methyltransferase